MKKKLLWLSDSPTTTTGYGTITQNVLNRLSDDYECHCLGHNYFGQVLKPGIEFEDGTKLNFFLHGAGKGKYSMDVINSIIQKYNIDIFGILLDTFMVYEAGFLNIDTAPTKTFFYYPSDGGGILPLNCENVLKKIHMPIAMSKFGQLQAEKAHKLKSEYIPLAFNPKLFYPLSDEEKAKARQKWALTNKFIVGTVARNQGRKMLDRTIKAFSLFCKDKPNVILLMHCDPMDIARSFDISELITRYKLNNRIIFSGATFNKAFDYAQMNEIYNLMDIFLLTTSGEGFGIPIIEAMACGIPQVVTDYTTTRELVRENIYTGEAIKLSGETEECPYPHTDEILDGTLTGSWNVERGIMSIKDCAKILNKLYKNPNMLKIYKDNCIVKARDYTWDKIMPMWKELLRRLIK